MMQAYKEAFCEEIRETLFSPQILQERIARMEEKIRDIESTNGRISKAMQINANTNNKCSFIFLYDS